MHACLLTCAIYAHGKETRMHLNSVLVHYIAVPLMSNWGSFNIMLNNRT